MALMNVEETRVGLKDSLFIIHLIISIGTWCMYMDMAMGYKDSYKNQNTIY